MRAPDDRSRTGVCGGARAPELSGASAIRVSVIIPTLNEAATIVTTLRRLKGLKPDKVVVADASSPDGTAELARL
jgi:cellulose synthase/poly-beta-1,6-N-acetylglucosamine synthase-like glycosyltransferase